jgi:GNAT superfamily N-acetyltransferase
MPADFLAGLSAGRRAAAWASAIRGEGPPDGRVYVAEHADDGIVGFAMAGPERTGTVGFDGELWAINIDAAHHRQGLGRRLMLAAAQWLAGKGYGAMMLWVVEANPACRFYERLGGTLIGQTREIALGGGTLVERGYGWRPLLALVSRLQAEARG